MNKTVSTYEWRNFQKREGILKEAIIDLEKKVYGFRQKISLLNQTEETNQFIDLLDQVVVKYDHELTFALPGSEPLKINYHKDNWTICNISKTLQYIKGFRETLLGIEVEYSLLNETDITSYEDDGLAYEILMSLSDFEDAYLAFIAQ